MVVTSDTPIFTRAVHDTRTNTIDEGLTPIKQIQMHTTPLCDGNEGLLFSLSNERVNVFAINARDATLTQQHSLAIEVGWLVGCYCNRFPQYLIPALVVDDVVDVGVITTTAVNHTSQRMQPRQWT
jgi:hypothetical protein